MVRCIPFVLAAISISCSNVTVNTDNSFEVVALPDNSIVFLNHNSSITYDEAFKPRRIELSGEAFFDVSSSTSSFVVSTTLGDVAVTGTSFNVKAEEDMLDVEVEEGGVLVDTKVAKQEIQKGERITYNKGSKKLQKAEASNSYKQWVKALKQDFKKLGKVLKRTGKKAGEASKDLGREIEEEGQRLRDKLKNL